MNNDFLLIDGASKRVQLILAHGAGAPMDSTFMNEVAARIAKASVEVARFEFPYMAARRRGERRPPDREATLLATWRNVVELRRDERRIFIGGKSMGGRMATMIADALDVDGVVCFGYPFHPPGKAQQLRIGHLETLRTSTLILQGTRDALGNRDEVLGYPLSRKVRVHWIEDGDHSLKPRVKSGRTLEQNLDEACATAVEFCRGGV